MAKCRVLIAQGHSTIRIYYGDTLLAIIPVNTTPILPKQLKNQALKFHPQSFPIGVNFQITTTRMTAETSFDEELFIGGMASSSFKGVSDESAAYDF